MSFFNQVYRYHESVFGQRAKNYRAYVAPTNVQQKNFSLFWQHWECTNSGPGDEVFSWCRKVVSTPSSQRFLVFIILQK